MVSHLNLQLFVGGLMSYLRYMWFFFAYSGVQHILTIWATWQMSNTGDRKCLPFGGAWVHFRFFVGGLVANCFCCLCCVVFFYLRPVSCGPHIFNTNQSINNNHSKKLMCYQDKGRVCSDIRTRLFISRDSYVPYLWNGIMLFVSQVSFLDAQIDKMWQENNSPHIYNGFPNYFDIVYTMYIFHNPLVLIIKP